MLKTIPVGSLLLVSGACSLIFQAVWFREFRLVFGASTLASSAVLTIFMGGLGLGNALLGRLADRSNQPLRLYARLEFLISAICALSPFLIDGVRFGYIAIGGQETLGIFGATMVRLTGAAMVIGIPTFLMGGTLPAAARAATSSNDTSRTSVGHLYGLNTFGAVLGVLLSSFFLIEAIGTRSTLWVACLFNLINATMAWRLAGQQEPAETNAIIAPGSHTLTNKRAPIAESPLRRLPPLLIYSAAALVGCVFFLMELVWYRMLGPILGGSTFTFGLILAVALAGIGIGGALYPLIFQRRQPTLHAFIFTLALEAIAIAIPIAIGDSVAVFALAVRGLAVFGFYGHMLSWTIITTLVVLPAAVISGLQFPLLISLLGEGNRNVGKEIGQTFGWNTIGSMIGSLLGGFGLISLITAPGVWRLAVFAVIIFAGVLLIYGYSRSTWLNTAAIASLLTWGVILSTRTGPTEVWRHGAIGAGRAVIPTTQNQLIAWNHEVRRNIIWQKDGLESTVAIDIKSSANFLVNGKSDGNAIGDAGTQIMLGVLPAILHSKPEKGLVIGLGTGESAGWLASLDSITSVDVVELEPVVTKMAELCTPINHNVLQHSKVNITFNDARELLLTTRKRYDLIASEPSNPYRSGISSLYTKEFYQAASIRLNPGGIFSQWLQGYEVSSSTVGTVLKTLRSVFPHVEMWQTQGGDMVLVCSPTPFEYTVDSISRRLKEKATAQATHVAWQTASSDGLLSRLIASEEFVNEVIRAEHLQLNTDDKNDLDFAFARTVGRSSEFQIEQVRQLAEEKNMRWPRRLNAAIDPVSIQDHEIASAIFTTRGVTFHEKSNSQRVEVWRAIQEDRISDAIRLWDAIGEPPTDFTEMLLIGLAFADGLDPRLPELLVKIAEISPADADALACIVSFQAGNASRTNQALCRLFDRLTQSPIVSESLLARCLLIARDGAGSTMEDNRELYTSLSRPFCLFLAEEKRIATLIEVSERLSPRETSDAMLSLEPFPIWNKAMLDLRYEAYRQLGIPLKEQARMDVLRYEQLSDKAFLETSLDTPSQPSTGS